MRIALAMLLALATSSSVRADDGVKDPDLAFDLSLDGTLASAGVTTAAVLCYSHTSSHGACDATALVGVTGLVLAPSLGHWYSGKVVTWGLGMRVLGGAAAIAGVGLAVAVGEADCGACAAPAGLLFFGGAALAVTGIVYDIATARSSARRYNDEHRVQIMPTVLHPPSGPVTMGLGVSGRF